MSNPKKRVNWRTRRKLSESERASRVATGREIEEYLLYLRSPWRVMAVNFFAGMMRGLGAAVGATAVVALLVWVMAKAVALPFVGEHFTNLRDTVDELVEEARFADDFQRVEFVLRRIERNTADALALQQEADSAEIPSDSTAELAD